MGQVCLKPYDQKLDFESSGRNEGRLDETEDQASEDNGVPESKQDQPIYKPHNGYYCNGCEVSPIIGTKWQCRMCNFDLCGQCKLLLIPHRHQLFPLTNPVDAKDGLPKKVDAPDVKISKPESCCHNSSNLTSSVSATVSSELGVTAEFLVHFREKHLHPESYTWQLKKAIIHPWTLQVKGPLVESLHPKYTGKANVFVSHAYSYFVLDAIEVMLRYENSHPGSIFWFDPFSLNQHGDGSVVETEVLEKAFGEQIKQIGATLIVSSPWNNPAFLCRSWCLFELMTSANVQVPITIELPSRQEKAFLREVQANSDAVLNALASIDSRNAKAREKADLEAINRSVERTVTHAGLNKLANKEMLMWLKTVLVGFLDQLAQTHEDVQKEIEVYEREEGKPNHETCQEMLAGLRRAERTTANEECRARSMVCRILDHIGFGNEAVEMHRPRIAYLRELAREDNEELLSALGQQGRLLINVHAYEEAGPLLQEAISGFKDRNAKKGTSPTQLLDIKHDMARFLKESGRQEEALVAFQELLKEGQDVFGNNEESTIHTKMALGNLLKEMDRTEEALPLLRHVAQYREAADGPRALSTLTAVNNLGSLLKKRGKLEQAQKMYRQVFEGLSETVGALHPRTLTSQSNLGGVLEQLGKHKQAEELYRLVLKGRGKVFGQNHPYTLFALNTLRRALQARGNPCCLEEIEKLFQRAVDAKICSLGEGHEESLSAMWDLAKFLDENGKVEKALVWFRRELSGTAARLGKRHEDTIVSAKNLIAMLNDEGLDQEARKVAAQYPRSQED